MGNDTSEQTDLYKERNRIERAFNRRVPYVLQSAAPPSPPTPGSTVEALAA